MTNIAHLFCGIINGIQKYYCGVRRVYPRIRDLRIEKGLSQKQVAELLGVSRKTYGDYEKGRSRIRARQMIVLADLYHTSVDYLIGLTDERYPYS
ncbi:helix-turn-helix domain-containing protein [Oscillibacter hominis]|uniref:helix-turn-helix domain-containing protein n=1 Tax=Oscillibacter hominis TaxID=2763056 RepID=UPI00298C0CAA|nr:helix-turn-helix transcriptional regulator [Oscillibacter hominis]